MTEKLNASELYQLMHFYVDAGVDWLVEEEPVDRLEEFKAFESQRSVEKSAVNFVSSQSQASSPQARLSGRDQKQPEQVRQTVAVPDAEAVALAQATADKATTVDQLLEAVRAFTGCNLRNSARNMAFFTGNPEAQIIVAGGVPGAEDDRHGQPFAGACGEMLDSMLSFAGLPKNGIGLLNLVPWRPPGNRAPTPHEMEVCRPFGRRLLELVQPQKILILGNLPIRFLTGSGESIHSARGQWKNISLGGKEIAAMATFHPSDLFAAPSCKKLAWRDLLFFRSHLTL